MNLSLVAYAPYENPEIAMAVMVPWAYEGNQGHHANNDIGRRVLDTYFELKKKRLEGNMNPEQPIQEIEHAIPAQSNFHTNGVAFAQSEGSDRLLGPGDHRALPGDGSQVTARRIERLGILQSFAQPDIDHNFDHAWHLHHIAVAKLALHRGNNFGLVQFFQSWCDGHPLLPQAAN